MRKIIRMTFGVLAALGFLASAAVHITALAGVDVAAHAPYVWLLHLGLFVVFIPFVFLARKDQRGLPSRSILARIPVWVAVSGGLLFAYTLINFALFIQQTQGGYPTAQGGDFLLLNHGALIRKLTPAEFTSLKANVLRGFSGHWMLFYFLPATYLLFGRPAAETSPSR